MDIRISAQFGWSEIFGGKFNSQSTCELDLSRQYSLIYADLATPGGTGLDVFSLLNDAFDTQLPTGKILVQDAGFFTFSHFGDGAPPSGTTLLNVFPQTPVPMSVAETTLSMDSTCGFWLTVRLKDIELFDSLIQIGYDTSAGAGDTLSLSALLASGTSAGSAVKQAVYEVALPNFKLFGMFGFENIKVGYQFTTARRLSISGNLTVTVFSNDYAFSGALISDDAKKTVTACLQAAQLDATIPSLFGGAMTGISFSNLVFGAYVQYGDASAQKHFQVQGSVKVGSAQLTGQIYLQNGTPQVASVKVDQTLSIGDLFRQCLGIKQPPTPLIDITFKAGSQLYYCATAGSAPLSLNTFACPASGGTGVVPVAPPASSIPYLPGFNIQAVFDLTLVSTLEVIGNIQIAKDGITASIALTKPIDIYILTIAAPKATSATGGPTLYISTVGDKASMGFAGSLWFMQASFGVDITVAASKNQSGNLQIDGTLTALSDYAPFLPKNTSLGVRYSKDGGFQITHWPNFEYLTKAIDFIKTLQKLSSEGKPGCGQLADFAFNTLLKSSFTISVSFSTQSNGVSLQLDGNYTLLIADTALTAVAIPFPGIVSIPLPNTAKLSELGAYIDKALEQAAESFVQGLLKNSEAIATLIALTAGKAAASYAATLACQHLIEGAAADAVASTAAAALAAAEAAAAGAAGAAAAVAGTVTAVVAILNGTGTGTGTQSAPTHPAVNINNTVVTLTWGGGQGNSGYHAQLLDSAAKVLLDQPGLAIEARQTTFEFASSWPTGTYKAQVQGTNASSASAWVEAPFQRLPTPADLAAHPDDSLKPPNTGVTLSWTAVQNALSYVLSSTHAGSTWTPDQTLQPTTPGQAPPTRCNVLFDTVAPAGDFSFTLVAHGNSATVPSLPTEALVLTRLGTPENLQATSTGVTATLRWQPVTGASGYQALITDADSALQVSLLNASTQGDNLIALLTLKGAPGKSLVYQLAVQALPVAGQLNVIAGAPSNAVNVTITAFSSAADMAKALIAEAVEGGRCGQLLLDAFPNLSLDTLASAMAQAGYAAADTSKGLLSAWPDTPPAALAAALTQAYPDPVQIARDMRRQGAPGADCAQALIKAYPVLTAKEMASAMAQAGYLADDTSSGLKAAFPALSPLEMSVALVSAYH